MKFETFLNEVEACNETFCRCIADYHKTNDIDADEPKGADGLQGLIYSKCWVDTVQWHLEDEIRRTDIDPDEALSFKRRIDASNQARTDMVEQLDDQYLERFQEVVPNSDARLNTESPAWAMDRLSILALKIFHMKEEADRKNADAAHREKCQQKLAVLMVQQEDLTRSIAQLLEDIYSGQRIMKVYRQMKMYNDPSLNPVLYKSGQEG
jgi:hypothetical protein